MLKNILIVSFLLLTFVLINSEEFHIVKKGDTIYRISKIYNVNPDDLINLNQIVDITNLSVGTKIIISKDVIDESKYYTVKSEDTLYSISKKFNIPISEILKKNNLKDNTITLNQKLLIDSNNENLTSVSPGNIVIKDDHKNESLPYWPIKGSITDYSGRIQGVKIEGNSGDYIQSVSNGRVIWYDSFKGIGKVVLIEGDNGYDYLYGTNEELNVKLGVQVVAGERLGRLKESNNSIIFSVFKNGKPLSDISNAPR